MLDKLLTTKYPLGVVLRAATLRADWIPRLQNEEADALTNWDFRHFDPARRIEVDLEKLRFAVLNDLFASGEEYLTELEGLKAKSRAARSAAVGGARTPKSKAERDWGKKGRTLRERDPW